MLAWARAESGLRTHSPEGPEQLCPALVSRASGCSEKKWSKWVEDRGAGLEGGLCAGLAPGTQPRSKHAASPSSRCRKGHLDRAGDGAPGNAPRGGDCPVALGWHAHWRGRGCGQAPLGCSWGLGRRFLAAPRERHTMAWVPPGACQEAVCQGGAQMPSASPSAPNLLGPPVGGQPACLRLGSSIHHLLCPQSTDPESPGLWCPPPAPGLCPGSRCSSPWAPRYTPWEGWVGTGGWDLVRAG